MNCGFTAHRYEVWDTDGERHTIHSRWMFNENGTLIFRHGERGNSRIIAAFGAGFWVAVKLLEPEMDTIERALQDRAKYE